LCDIHGRIIYDGIPVLFRHIDLWLSRYKLDNDVHGAVLCITLFTPIAKPHSLAVDILVMIRIPEKKVKNGKPRVCFITAFEEFRSEFKETFPTVEEVDCFLKKPIPMPNLVMRVKSQLGLL